MRTRFQSASSSSATIIGRLVRTPVPISARCATIVTMPSGAIATNTRGSTTVPCGILSAPVWYAAKPGRDITGAAKTKPPASPRPFRMLRRETLSTLTYRSKPRSFLGLVRIFMSHPRRCKMDRVFDALVAAAPADIPGQGFADLVVRRFWIIHQQRRCLHDLAGLAKAALRHVELPPG